MGKVSIPPSHSPFSLSAWWFDKFSRLWYATFVDSDTSQSVITYTNNCPLITFSTISIAINICQLLSWKHLISFRFKEHPVELHKICFDILCDVSMFYNDWCFSRYRRCAWNIIWKDTWLLVLTSFYRIDEIVGLVFWNLGQLDKDY